MTTYIEDSFTYSNPAEWFDSICGSKHIIHFRQYGNRIKVRLNAEKDYEWIRWGNISDGKWHSVKKNHSMRVKIKDVLTQEYFIGDLSQGRLVKAGDDYSLIWDAPYASEYEVEWVENSTGDCKGINNYVGSKRFTITNADIQSEKEKEQERTNEIIDTVGTVLAGTLVLTLVYSLYRFVK